MPGSPMLLGKTGASRTPQDASRCPLLEGRPEDWIRCCTARFGVMARRITGNDATARDAMQEGWAAVVQGLRLYRGGCPACAWVGTIVRNAAIREGRRQGRYVPLETEQHGERLMPQVHPTGAGPEQEAYRAEMARLLREAIRRLSPMDREIIRLRDVEDRTPADNVSVEIVL